MYCLYFLHGDVMHEVDCGFQLRAPNVHFLSSIIILLTKTKVGNKWVKGIPEVYKVTQQPLCDISAHTCSFSCLHSLLSSHLRNTPSIYLQHIKPVTKQKIEFKNEKHQHTYINVKAISLLLHICQYYFIPHTHISLLHIY